MPQGLRRFHNTGQRHFITRSCYLRQPFLGSVRRRDYFLKVFEEVRQKYDLVVWGYVVMPEHFHILISEPAERKCRPRDAGVETASLEELPSKEESCRSDQLMEVASCAGVLAATLARF